MNQSKFHQTLATLQPISESHHPHVEAEKAHLFSAPDATGSSEIETLEFLYAFVRLTKPERVIETGTCAGFGTLAIASALKENGHGKVVTIDLGEALNARKRISGAGLANYVDFVRKHSLEYITDYSGEAFDMGFFDSDLSCRATEFNDLFAGNKITRWALFHDTSRTRLASMEFNQQYIDDLDDIEGRFGGGLEFTLSRGLRVFQIS